MDSELIRQIKTARDAIRAHRDAVGHERCWLNDYVLWAVIPGSSEIPTELRPIDVEMVLCEDYFHYRSAKVRDTMDDAILDPAHWDDDLATLDVEGLTYELGRVEAAIRHHRDVQGTRTVKDDRVLYSVLPEGIRADFRLPPAAEFLLGSEPHNGCRHFWESHAGCPGRHDLRHWGPCPKH